MAAFTSTILITGGTTGLGFWAAYHMARKCPNSKVIIASRKDKEDACGRLRNLLQKNKKSRTMVFDSSQIEYLSLDLGSASNVRAFVAAFISKAYPPISHLLLNAGLQFYAGKEVHYSPEGLEMTFAVNHVGHALLFFLLKPHLTREARIVVVASGTHDPAQKTMVPNAVYESAELLAHPTDNDGYEAKRKGLQRYASSKLANVLFTYALERRLKTSRDSINGHKWTVAAFDPGLMPGTGLGRDAPAFVFWMFMHIATHLVWLMRLHLGPNVHLPQDSGRNLADLAAMGGEQAIETSGRYWEGAKEIPSSVDSHERSKQEDLWNWTVDFLSKDNEEKAAFERF